MTSSILPGLAEASEGGGSVVGAGCISREPLGGFCSFFQGKPIWQSRVNSQKSTTLGLIPWILEGFSITMVTLSDFFKISNRKDALCLHGPLPAKFRTDQSRNGAGRGGRCHKPYCFYSMIRENKSPMGKSHRYIAKFMWFVNWVWNSWSSMWFLIYLRLVTSHEAFIIEIRCLEGTFGCKIYDLSDWYRLYIGCKKAGSTITNQNKGLLDRIRLIPWQWGRQWKV